MTSQNPPTHRSQPARALDRLDTAQDYQLAILIAPAGSGKTAGLERWAAECRENSLWEIAWVALGEEDNSPEVFLKNLENAIGRCEYEGTSTDLDLNALEDRIARLINHLAAARENFILIFDHYQAIRSPLIHAAVQLLLDYLPPQLRVIIASSSEPPLALPRMRVRRRLLELGPEDLNHA